MINPKKIYKIEYCLSAGANAPKKCLPHGKNAHMFSEFTFEDINGSFVDCDANKVDDKKSLKWLREKIDYHNEQNKNKKDNQWSILNIYKNSSLTIPQLLVVFEDKRIMLLKYILYKFYY